MLKRTVPEYYGQLVASAVIIALGSSIASPVNAQAAKVMPENSVIQNPISGNQSSKLVSLSVSDSTIEWIAKEIGRRANLKVVYNSGLADIKKRTSVNVRNVDAVDAIRTALKGTKLQVNKTADGLGVMISSTTNNSLNSGGTVVTDSASIVGVVVDSATGKGVANVNIQIPGLSRHTSTDANGAFRLLNISPGKYVLNAKLLGYVSYSLQVELKRGGVETVRIVLKPAPTSLTEVVTTATGAQRRVEVAHDIAKIDVEAVMQRSPVRSITDLLEAAQVPGILVQKQSGDPGSPSRIRIRGIGSISQTNDPVVILDGVWIDGSMGKPSRIDDIDPSTIESIEIVRGPSAATLYGQDASNGIIVITSKKGNVGKPRWNVQYSRDWGETYAKKPLIYVGQGRARTNSNPMQCNVIDILYYRCFQDSVDVYDPNHKLLSKEGTETNNRFSLQLDGGVNTIQYAISANFQDQTGVRQNAPVDLIRARRLGHTIDDIYLRPSRLSRKSLSSSLTLNPLNNLSIALNVNGTQSDLTDNSYSMTFVPHSAWSLDTINIQSLAYTSVKNPVKSTTVVMGSNVNWRPASSYVINGTFGLERFNGTDNKLQVREDNISHDATNTMKQDNKSIYTARINASTSLNLGKVSRYLEIRPSIGGDYKQTDQNSFTFQQRKIPPGQSGIVGGADSDASYYKLANATAGWYINSSFGLFQRLYFDLGIRQDIGSAITSSDNTRYPKLGSSWLVSDESFWPENNFVNLFRIRGAIGHSAVQPDLTDIHGRYVNGYAYINGRYVSSVDQDRPGNPRLNPERATEIELGFDADVLYNRVNLIVTYARAQNRNSLINRDLPSSLGMGLNSIRKENVARVLNANLELAAIVKAVETHDHNVTVNYNLTLSNNRVTRLGDGVSPFFHGSVSRVQEGYPLAGVWSRVVMGYIDVDKDGLLSNEEMVLSDSTAFLGWTQPRIKASYGVSWTIRNSITFDSRFAYQGNYVQSLTIGNTYASASKDASLADQAVINVHDLIGKRNVSDLRWNSASISYFLPPSLLTRIKARSVNVSLQASNIAIWTNYMGRDPGVNSSIMSGELLSDNGNTTPRPRLYVLTFRWGL